MARELQFEIKRWIVRDSRARYLELDICIELDCREREEMRLRVTYRDAKETRIPTFV